MATEERDLPLDEGLKRLLPEMLEQSWRQTRKVTGVSTEQIQLPPPYYLALWNELARRRVYFEEGVFKGVPVIMNPWDRRIVFIGDGGKLLGTYQIDWYAAEDQEEEGP